jgi:hypothetical protein
MSELDLELPVIEEVQLTEEQLEQEKQEQLIKFKNDKTRQDLYSNFVPRTKRVLVEIFQFKPSVRTALDKGLFMVKSEIDQTWTPRTLAISEKLYPIVRVLRKSEDCSEDIEVGKMYTVPVDDISGTSWNPDFMHALQQFAGKSGTQGSFTNVPENMPQRLPNIEINWKNYYFGMPDKAGLPGEDDGLIFLIPEGKLTTVYEFNS